MKVRCNRVLSEGSGEDLGEDGGGFVIKGKEYVVLAVRIMPKWGIFVCLLEENYSPFFSQLLGFEITSQRIPASWEFQFDPKKYLDMEIMPKSWINTPSFYERVEDGDREAIDLFYKEAANAYEEEGLKVPWLEEE